MKYNFTPVRDDHKDALNDMRNLLRHGVDSKGKFVSVSDALTYTDQAVVKRAIEEIILTPTQPNLVGSFLVRTASIPTTSRMIAVRTLGALDAIDFAVSEEGEYTEVSAGRGNGSMIELRFQKYGALLKISHELIEHSSWEMISAQIQELVNALARHRDQKIMQLITSSGIVVFDNKTPNASFKGRTTGRNITGAGNGSITHENLIDMYSVLTMNGYTPRVLLCHPMHWAMFAKDPIIREAGIMKGDLSTFLRSTINPQNPYDVLKQIPGARRELTDRESEVVATSKPEMPSYSPLSGLTVITSPLVPYDPTARTADVIMLDPDHTAILGIAQPLMIDEWDEKRNDIRVIKFCEKWSLEALDNGRAIAIARNVSLNPNEMNVNPQLVINDIAPINPKD